MNVGIGTIARNYNNPVADLKNFMRKHPVLSRRLGGRSGTIMGHYIPYNGILPKTYSSKTLLVGDAAGFVNTLTGEGIYMAIKSAKIASEVLSRALDDDEIGENVLSSYQTAVLRDAELGEEVRIGRLLRNILFSDTKLIDGIFELAKEEDKLRRLIIDLVFVRKNYRDLVREFIKVIPWELKLKMFAKASGNIMKLVLNAGDPYFPSG